MVLVAFLRGVNVGGHKSFRPSTLARKLSHYDVVNVGAAGTFVVWKPGPVAKFRAELLRELPFDSELMLCKARELVGLTIKNPFGSEPSGPDIVRFVSILARADCVRPSLPLAFPSEGEWLVRLVACQDQFVFGEYRRHMKTISQLGKVDKLFGAQATTRNWNTIMAIAKILKSREDSSL